METIFINTENSETSEPYRIKLDLTNKYMTLAYFSIYYTWKNIKSEYNNNKFKILVPTLNDTFDLPDLLIIFRIILNSLLKKYETLEN